MKKLGLLIMPIITTSLLVNCDNNTPPPPPPEPTKYSLVVTCNRGLVTGNKEEYDENEEVALTFTPFEGYRLPELIDNIELTGIDKTLVTYKSVDGSLSFKMPANPVSVKVTATRTKNTLTVDCVNATVTGNKIEYGKDEEVALTFTANEGYLLPATIDDIELNGIDKTSAIYSSTSGTLTFKMPDKPVSAKVAATDESWYLNEEYIDSLGVEDIGTKQTIKVNGINHTVRLIDVDHDTLTEEVNGECRYAHTTWEFANLLSDSDGYSLATPWNCEDGESSVNTDYLNSNLRKAFDGDGDGELIWYRKGQTTSEQTQQTEYADKTVYDMLPSDLQNVLKEVNKPITSTASYDAKVFPLSCVEMTEKEGDYSESEGSTYEFYKGDGDTDKNRIKHQVKWFVGSETSYTDITDKEGMSYSYAGYNYTDLNDGVMGGRSWSRSPNVNDQTQTFAISERGKTDTRPVYIEASAVVPAFCLGEKQWYESEKYINSLSEEDVGVTQTLKVNGIDQTVRLIGVNHDGLSSGSGTAHTTWEFVDFLSDEDGYSLATLWHCKDGESYTNEDYLNSNLRKAFDGDGDGELIWYRKGQATSEQTQKTEYANKTVLSMLPSKLQDVLKEVKKPIAATSPSYDAKVFPLSYTEMTKESSEFAEVEGTTYKYYQDHDTQDGRMKHQIKWDEGAATDYTAITEKNAKYNYAGYNFTHPERGKLGGRSWLRSPSTGGTINAWMLGDYGSLTNYWDVSEYAFAVAPAFCI